MPVDFTGTWKNQHGSTLELRDTGGAVSRLYGSALSVPGFGTFSNRQTYVIDPDGNLRWVFTDVESRIPRHSGEVLEKLSEPVITVSSSMTITLW